jgi:hypothetical protein
MAGGTSDLIRGSTVLGVGLPQVVAVPVMSRWAISLLVGVLTIGVWVAMRHRQV